MSEEKRVGFAERVLVNPYNVKTGEPLLEGQDMSVPYGVIINEQIAKLAGLGLIPGGPSNLRQVPDPSTGVQRQGMSNEEAAALSIARGEAATSRRVRGPQTQRESEMLTIIWALFGILVAIFSFTKLRGGGSKQHGGADILEQLKAAQQSIAEVLGKNPNENPLEGGKRKTRKTRRRRN